MGESRESMGCRVYWGSHGCRLRRGHSKPHVCVCDDPGQRDDGNVGGPPYYGPKTRFYGEDAPLLHRVRSRVRGAWFGWRMAVSTYLRYWRPWHRREPNFPVWTYEVVPDESPGNQPHE